jgi:CRP-like cAMP-binding protein
MKGLGKVFQDGEIIVKQGDEGDCMYVIQSGKVDVYQERGGREIRVGVLGKDDFFGEMAVFEHEVRSATVRAVGEVQVLTIGKKTMMGRIAQDPSMAFRLLQKMSNRIRTINDSLTFIKATDRRNWDARPAKMKNDDDA